MKPARGIALLEAAIDRIQQGQATYGAPAEHFAVVAELWSVLLQTDVSPQDVMRCMVALKLARLTGPGTPVSVKDSLLDIAGYAACGWDSYRAD